LARLVNKLSNQNHPVELLFNESEHHRCHHYETMRHSATACHMPTHTYIYIYIYIHINNIYIVTYLDTHTHTHTNTHTHTYIHTYYEIIATRGSAERYEETFHECGDQRQVPVQGKSKHILRGIMLAAVRAQCRALATLDL
jgi:hypothetical protein